jgi:hypothetical protein
MTEERPISMQATTARIARERMTARHLRALSDGTRS